MYSKLEMFSDLEGFFFFKSGAALYMLNFTRKSNFVIQGE